MADDQSKLEPFEGTEVVSVGMEIPGAAGGLREALKIDPVQLHKDAKVFVLLETTVAKIRFDPDKDNDDGLRRVHILDVEQGMLVDEDLVRAHLDEQAKRIQELHDREAAERRRKAGEFTLDEAQLNADHEAGKHADGLVDGCPECDDEKALVAAEAAAEAQANAPTPIGGRKARGAAAS